MAKITDKQAKAVKPGDKAIPGGITGLWLRAGASPGTGKWVLRFTSPVTRKRRDMGLGSYPDVIVAKALDDAQAIREQIAAGIDPIEARRNQSKIPTFEEAARIYWQELKPGFRNDKHKAQWIATLEQHMFPHIGHFRLDKLEPQHFADALRPIWLTIPVTAQRVRRRCSRIMAWGWARKYVTGNPLDVTEHLLAAQPNKTNHLPAMPWAKVGRFVADHLQGERLIGGKAALLFAILTAARSGEVRGATWGEIDLDGKLWTVPGERMKAGVIHRVPLSDAAVDLLRKQFAGDGTPPADALMFPSQRGKELSDMAMTTLLRRTQAPSDVPGRVATAHGFRSSFRNWAADHGYANDLAERALAHTIGNKARAAYERTDRLKARRDMMQDWADYLQYSGQGGKVIPLKSALGRPA